MNCRFCKNPLSRKFLDLGFAPPSNAYLTEEGLLKPEMMLPLRIYFCEHCFLVQTEDYAPSEELFTDDYAYFSSVSESFCDHARSYSEMIIQRLSLDRTSHVLEVACNDGYLLRNFVERGIPCKGYEPTASTAKVARTFNIPVIEEFFGKASAKWYARKYGKADLVIGNNVYAHIPDINDFTAGLKEVLSPAGTITLEFQHLLNMVRLNQFDTVYHEHYSYLSLHTVSRIFEKHGLKIYDVEKIDTHGGSLRVYGCHRETATEAGDNVYNILHEEDEAGMSEISFYASMQQQANLAKNNLLEFLIRQARAGILVAAYGAAAKANTLFNFSGIRPDLIPFICDAAPSKQGKFLPGSHIPIVSVEELKKQKPGYILIVPWNIRDEIIDQLAFAGEWGARFVTAIPLLQVFKPARPVRASNGKAGVSEI
jgi:SAM-dependent methyltransferase